MLWNLSAGSIPNVSPNEMRRIAIVTRNHAVHKKTAYFGSVDLQFGLLRMYATYAEIESVPPVIQVFRSRNESIEWLKG